MRFNSKVINRSRRYNINHETSTDRYFDLDESRFRSLKPNKFTGFFSSLWNKFVDLFREKT